MILKSLVLGKEVMPDLTTVLATTAQATTESAVQAEATTGAAPLILVAGLSFLVLGFLTGAALWFKGARDEETALCHMRVAQRTLNKLEKENRKLKRQLAETQGEADTPVEDVSVKDDYETVEDPVAHHAGDLQSADLEATG